MAAQTKAAVLDRHQSDVNVLYRCAVVIWVSAGYRVGVWPGRGGVTRVTAAVLIVAGCGATPEGAFEAVGETEAMSCLQDGAPVLLR